MRFGTKILLLYTAFSLTLAPFGAHAAGCGDDLASQLSETELLRVVDVVFAALARTLDVEPVIPIEVLTRDADDLIDRVVEARRMTDLESRRTLHAYGRPFAVDASYSAERARRAGWLVEDALFRIARLGDEHALLNRETPLAVAVATNRLWQRPDLPEELRENLGDCFVGRNRTFADYAHMPGNAHWVRPWLMHREAERDLE